MWVRRDIILKIFGKSHLWAMLKNDKETTVPTNQCPVTFLSVLQSLQKKISTLLILKNVLIKIMTGHKQEQSKGDKLNKCMVRIKMVFLMWVLLLLLNTFFTYSCQFVFSQNSVNGNFLVAVFLFVFDVNNKGKSNEYEK